MPNEHKPKKSPAFQFYSRDFLDDENQKVMSLAASGIYIRLIAHCWLEGSLPNEPVKLARLAGATKRQIVELWPSIAPCFRQTGEGRLIHPRLEFERVKQATFRQRQSDKGAASAAMREALAVQKSTAQLEKTSNLLTMPTAIQDPPVNGAISEIAQDSHGALQPRLNSGSPPVSTGRQPDVNSSVFCLQTSVKEKRFADGPCLSERYGEIYERVRHAHYHIIPKRDGPAFAALEDGWPLPRLAQMLEVFLLMPAKEANNIPGTPGQFLHMAPECDRRLRENGL